MNKNKIKLILYSRRILFYEKIWLNYQWLHLLQLVDFFIPSNVLASEVTKEGTEVSVKQPEIDVTRQDDTFYTKIDVKVSTAIPDNITINQGDTMTMPLPKELELKQLMISQ